MKTFSPGPASLRGFLRVPPASLKVSCQGRRGIAGRFQGRRRWVIGPSLGLGACPGFIIITKAFLGEPWSLGQGFTFRILGPPLIPGPPEVAREYITMASCYRARSTLRPSL